MRLYGIIKKCDKDRRILTLETKFRLYYIYFKRSLMHTFKNYLNASNLLDIEVVEPKKYGKYYCYQAYYINKIKSLSLDKLYFSEDRNLLSLKYLLNNIRNVLVLDLEMTMPPYNYKGAFNSEIIQMGFILYNDKGEEILNYNNYIKAKSELNNRTSNFLNITKREFYKNAISYYKAYKDFNNVLKKYSPAIIVYGKNDILALKNSFNLYQLPNILTYRRVVNLASLIQSYYHHLNEYGLFNLFKEYYKTELYQEHNALSDAIVTYDVFKAFKNDVLNNRKSISE